MTKVRALTEIFNNEDSVTDAILILGAVPKNTGCYDERAKLRNIVHEAFKGKRKGEKPLPHIRYVDMEVYPREYRILETLKKEGYVVYAGADFGVLFYTLPKF